MRLLFTVLPNGVRQASAIGASAAACVVVLATASSSPATPVSKHGLTRRSAVSITSIAPAQGFRGDTVTITGNGFGGPNVRVTVGGVAAQVVSATGSTASFVVPSGAPLGQTTVRATNPGGQYGEIGFTVLFDGNVTPVLDQPDAVQKQIGPQGGTITTGGGITLQIPAGALGDTQTITLTPLSAVQGSPLTSLLGGVELDPEGLHFLIPATLTLPLPAGVDPQQLVGFGFDDGGTSFHLKPPVVNGGTLSVQISHFSGGGAGTLAPAQSSAVLGYQPTSAQELAEQQMSAALYDFEHGSIDSNTRDTRIDNALSAWYQTSVKVGLQVVGNSIDFFELAMGEWQAWFADVQAWSDTSRHATENSEATTLAMNDAAHLADLALSACNGSGSDPLAALQPVLRLASDLIIVPLAIETKKGSNETQLPPADGLANACVHVTIKQLNHPAVFAFALTKNTLNVSVEVDFWTGTSRTDFPVAVDLYDVTDGPKSSVAGDTTSNGSSAFTFAAGPKPHRKYAVIANLPGDPSLHDPTHLGALGDEKDFDLDVRDRVELHSNATIAPGSTVSLQALLAGDGVTGATVSFSNSGQGTLSTSSATTDANGTTTVDYTASTDPAGSTDTVTASFDDDTGAVTARATITISAGTCSSPDSLLSFRLTALAQLSQSNACSSVDVSIQPTTITLAPDQQTSFTATVTGASDQTVTWTATGGTIDQNGTYTAGATPGTYTVTATSNADPSAHDTATVTIALPTGVTRVSPHTDGGVFAGAKAFVDQPVNSCPGGDGGSDSQDSPLDAQSWGASVNCGSSGLTADDSPASADANATESFDDTYIGSDLLRIQASGSANGTASDGHADATWGYSILFNVSKPITMTVQASVAAGGEGTGELYVRSGTTGTYYAYLCTPPSSCANGTQINTSFPLPPGSYIISADGGGTGLSFDASDSESGSSNFDFTVSFG